MSESYRRDHAKIVVHAEALRSTTGDLLKAVTQVADVVIQPIVTGGYAREAAEAVWRYQMHRNRVRDELVAFERASYTVLRDQVRAYASLRHTHPSDDVDHTPVVAYGIAAKLFRVPPYMSKTLDLVRAKDWKGLAVDLGKLPVEGMTANEAALRGYLLWFLRYHDDTSGENLKRVCTAAYEAVDAAVQELDVVEDIGTRVDFLSEIFQLVTR